MQEKTLGLANKMFLMLMQDYNLVFGEDYHQNEENIGMNIIIKFTDENLTLMK